MFSISILLNYSKTNKIINKDNKETTHLVPKNKPYKHNNKDNKIKVEQ